MVEVFDPITKITYNYYINPKLKHSLQTKVKNILLKQDEDYVLVVDGKERTGKSVLAMQIGKFVDPTLSLDRICFTPEEFRKGIIGATKGQCVIFDEAYRGLGSTGALSEVNRILKSLMMEMGQKNLFVIVVLPTLYLLEKYVALWRTRCLIHVYKSGGRKGYWTLFNSKKKQMLYLDPKGKRFYSYTHVKTNFKGRFYGNYTVNEAAYRRKKSKSFTEGFKRTRDEKYMDQRNTLIWILYDKLKISQENLSKELKMHGVALKRSAIRDILLKFKERV